MKTFIAVMHPLVALACLHGAHEVPNWYSATRYHAHTRLAPPAGYCSVETKSCKPVFNNTASLFSEIGVRAYVRHTHEGSDGDWMQYPSAPIPTEGLVPFVAATGRQLPVEFAKSAHEIGSHLIAYHYPRCHSYYSSHEPGWLSRDTNGNPVKFSRGLGLCINSGWRDVYLAQLHDLVYHAGVDGVYVDEYPIPPGGCFCESCRAKYKEWSGGEAMPQDPPADPQAYRRVLDFNTYTVTKFYGDIASTIADASAKGLAAGNRTEAAIPFLSNHQLPCADSGGELFEWQGMEAHDGLLSAPKIEYDTGRGGSCIRGFRDNLANSSFDTDILITWGWAGSRDAGYGRPPHTWDPASHLGSDFVQCGAGAMVSYGLVANPDHAEAQIPNAPLFKETYEVGDRLSPVLNGTVPLRWAQVVMDEWRRNELVPLNNTPPTADQDVWTGLMGETLGAWQTVTRWGVPRGVLHLWQIGVGPNENATGPGVSPNPQAALQGTKVLVIPEQARLTASQAEALRSFVGLGGTVVNMTGIPTGVWLQPKVRDTYVKQLQAKIAAAAGAPPAQLVYTPKPSSVQAGMGSGDAPARSSGLPVLPQSIDAHMNVLAVPGQGNERAVLAVTNAFGWCGEREHAPVRPPNMTDAKVEVGLAAGVSARDVSAFDHVSQKQLVVQTSALLPQTAEVILPEVQFYAMVEVKCSGGRPCFRFE